MDLTTSEGERVRERESARGRLERERKGRKRKKMECVREREREREGEGGEERGREIYMKEVQDLNLDFLKCIQRDSIRHPRLAMKIALLPRYQPFKLNLVLMGC